MRCDMCGEKIIRSVANMRYGVVEWTDESTPRYLCHECMEAITKAIDEHHDIYVKLVDDDGQPRQ